MAYPGANGRVSLGGDHRTADASRQDTVRRQLARGQSQPRR